MIDCCSTSRKAVFVCSILVDDPREGKERALGGLSSREVGRVEELYVPPASVEWILALRHGRLYDPLGEAGRHGLLPLRSEI